MQEGTKKLKIKLALNCYHFNVKATNGFIKWCAINITPRRTKYLNWVIELNGTPDIKIITGIYEGIEVYNIVDWLFHSFLLFNFLYKVSFNFFTLCLAIIYCTIHTTTNMKAKIPR